MSAVSTPPHRSHAPAERRSRIFIRRLPTGSKEQRAVALTVARALSVPAPPLLELLNELPAAIPTTLESAEATALVDALRERGAEADLDAVASSGAACTVHPKLDASGTCARCDAPLCALCRPAGAARALCPRCRARARRAQHFYRFRVATLLLVLLGVLAYAWRDVHQRRARNTWDAPVSVGVVIVREEPLDAGAIEALQAEARRLEDKLAAELERYRPGHDRPFQFTVFGPIDQRTTPPRPAEGWIGTVRFAAELWWYSRGLNRAAGVDSSDCDTIVYLFAHRPKLANQPFIEGLSQQGGRIGIVQVELDPTMAGFASFVIAHELMHTLGASDKYDAAGFAIVPDGLGDPELVPRYPQRRAEVMARNVALAPRVERPPASLDELRVGPRTAREIGWLVP